MTTSKKLFSKAKEDFIISKGKAASELKLLRKAQDLRLKEVADKLKITPEMLSDYENGNVSFGILFLISWAFMLGVTMEITIKHLSDEEE